MNINLLVVPFDTARRGWRMGAGPEHLLERGLVARLRAAGHAPTVTQVLPGRDLPFAEIATAFALMRQIAALVRAAVAAHRFPLVLSGNCNTAVGTLSGLTPRRRAVFWFDAHGDVNTAETTISGFLDGMALATALGWCWRNLAATIDGFEPLDAADVSLFGARDLDPPERELLDRARIPVVHELDTRVSQLAPIVEPLSKDRSAYVHCDLDVLHPRYGRVNSFPMMGSFEVEVMAAAIAAIGRTIPLAAAAVTAYAPEYDKNGTIRDAAFRIIDAIVGAAAAQR